MNEPERDTKADALWRRRRLRDMKAAGVLEGPGYLYRAQECLIATEDEPRLADALRREGGRADQEQNADLDRLKIGVRKWKMAEDVDIPTLVRRLRALGDNDWQPKVAPNTVFSGEPNYQGGPGGPPTPATDAADWPETKSSREDKPGIGVLDTGYSGDVQTLHAALFQQLRPDPMNDDVDVLDLDKNGLLDTQAGHGTFIAGLVRRVAPDLVIDPERVLDPYGWGDDVSVTIGLAQQTAPVINLSFGAYTEDDRPPLALDRAIGALRRDVVVVAAAGNNGSDRPFWPAACKNVIAVGAVDSSTDPPTPAKFSNYGRWVDVCAPGVDLSSSFVRGTWQMDRSTPAEEFDGWACWSGTSFAAPLVAAEIALRVRSTGKPARLVAMDLLASLDYLGGAEGYGVYYDPGVDLVCRKDGCD